MVLHLGHVHVPVFALNWLSVEGVPLPRSRDLAVAASRQRGISLFVGAGGSPCEAVTKPLDLTTWTFLAIYLLINIFESRTLGVADLQWRKIVFGKLFYNF